LTFHSKLKDEYVDKLFEAILLLENEEECYRFFEDICTVSEIKSLAQRLEVAKMLTQNKTYTSISRETGASTATVSRVKRSLDYGAGGYKLVLKRLSERTSEG
jgi:TrpR-related protein YerC/YecD